MNEAKTDSNRRVAAYKAGRGTELSSTMADSLIDANTINGTIWR